MSNLESQEYLSPRIDHTIYINQSVIECRQEHEQQNQTESDEDCEREPESFFMKLCYMFSTCCSKY